VAEQDQRLAEALAREGRRLDRFIRRQVADAADAEDILQDVFVELVEATRLAASIEHVGAWLFRVARNRVIDLLRKRRPEISTAQPIAASAEGEPAIFEDLLPSADQGPEAAYARQILLDELEEAIEELPEEQRRVFVAHEIDGQSFKTLADATGVSINTLLGRKRYAVLHLRKRLKAIHDDFLTHS